MNVNRMLWLTVALAGAGCGAAPEPAHPAPGPPVAVALTTVTSQPLATHVETGGVVRPVRTAVIGSRVMAPVVAVHVAPGDRVRRGEVLISLDNRELSARRAAADAAWKAAEDATAAADADARAALAAVTLAGATFRRIDALADKQSATAQERDQAAAALASSEAQLESARARVAAARAGRDAARHVLDAAVVGVTYAALEAPFDGVVSERHADPGSLAMPGAPLLVVEDTSRYRLEVALDSARAGRVAVGDAVEARLDGWADGAWIAARIDEIARVDPVSHSFVVKADLPAGAALASGRFGRLRLAGPARDTLTIPATAAVQRGQLTFVFVVDGQGLARLRPITAAEAGDEVLEVLAGLRGGDLIVAAPPLSLVDGAQVAPSSLESAASRPQAARS